MRHPALALLAGMFVATLLAADPSSNQGVKSPAPAVAPWPDVGSTAKPWTRWWWPGSAVDEVGLTRQLEQLAAAGFGGVEITPIYGAKGAEERYVSFLSPRWVALLAHVGREAQRLGLGVDMATGTGWPFGGPWVQPEDGSHKLVLEEGRLTGAPTAMKVKRAAPGGEGLVLDPYSPTALDRYLQPFTDAFAALPAGTVRAQFHDSFEYYEAGWTARLPEVFRELHGYDLQDHAAELLGEKPLEERRLARLKGDYRSALAELHLDYLRAWVDWSHRHGWLVRNQSHGAPANLLDLYAHVDIAETEVFGSTPFPLPGLRRDPKDVRHDQDLPDDLVIQLAASASHVAGHRLASSETATWLREHWKESLAALKPEIDRLLVSGINHIFYHGTVYSPPAAAWPGWLFYASTQLNPQNPLWEHVEALNAYVARAQSVLQSGAPDQDILVYWPIHDVWDDARGLMKQLGVHHVEWLTDQPAGRLARRLLDEGYGYDFISDAQLTRARALQGRIVTTPPAAGTAPAVALAPAASSYKIILVPATRRMPVETFRQLVALATAGARVHFLQLPEDVPGLGRLEARRSTFKGLLDEARKLAEAGTPTLSLGSPAANVTTLPKVLAAAGVTRETFPDHGLRHLRRRSASGCDYFVANLTAKPVDEWVVLGVPAQHVALLDPLSGGAGTAALRQRGGHTEVYLQLAPGESILLRTTADDPDGRPPLEPWSYVHPNGHRPHRLEGPWTVDFLRGGPELPASVTTPRLESWTEFGGPAAERFAGTARYRLEFTVPSTPADDWLLQLGDVRESARIRLNGVDLGTVWAIPLQRRVGRHLQADGNVLEIEVANLAANRIRDLDRRKVPWKIMREINFVNINYKPFDASDWDLTPSGLLGPVILVPLESVRP